MSWEFCSFPTVLLAMEEYHQPIWVWIIQRDCNIPDLNFYKNFQKLAVFQIHYFIKYITFKNTKLSAALLNDTNKKQNIFTFIIIYLTFIIIYFTFASPSISSKPWFAFAAIRSLGIVAHSISTAVGCSVSALVYICKIHGNWFNWENS